MGLRAFVGALVFAAGAGFTVCPAAAADLSVPPTPVPVAPVASAPAAIFSWTGLYIGGHAGVGLGRPSWSDPVSGANNIFASGAGFVGGAQAGANLQFNRLVLGVEGDFSYAVAGEIGECVLVAGESDAALAVDEKALEGRADAAGHGRCPIGIGADRITKRIPAVSPEPGVPATP